ncbi:MAG: S8 family serine peptidase [Actinomycetota bacterium]
MTQISSHDPRRRSARRHRRRRGSVLVAIAATLLLAATASPAEAKKGDPKKGVSCSSAEGYSHEDAVGSLYNIADAIKADKVWKDGHTGAGVDVALIDTGVVPVKGLDGPNKVINGPDFSLEADHADVRHLDTYGHGTHLAGIIAANDTDDADEKHEKDEFQGIAPDARIVNLKVADHTGAVDVTQVIAAIDWAVANRNANGLNIRVINLSYRAPGSIAYESDPLSRAIQNAWDNGIVVVVAAGNDGSGTTQLASPAHDPFAIAVSAVVGKDQVKNGNCLDKKPKWEHTDYASAADKHNRGPDVFAPGTTIVSLRNPGGTIDQLHPTSAVGDRFTKATGTSQSAAVVSGAVALLLDARPELTPDEVKALLIHASKGKDKTLDIHKAVKKSAPKNSQQNHARSNGRGSLDDLRGNAKIRLNGRDIRADETPFGPWSPQDWVATSTDGSAWTGSSWTGSSWTGSSWTGSSWTGSSWTGSSWTGSSWTGSSWTGSSWTGSSWTGDSWANASWD